MKLLFALFLILLPLTAAASECLPSLPAARLVHPKGHISWGGGCYFAGYPGERRPENRGGAHRRQAGRIPVPSARPESAGLAQNGRSNAKLQAVQVMQDRAAFPPPGAAMSPWDELPEQLKASTRAAVTAGFEARGKRR